MGSRAIVVGVPAGASGGERARPAASLRAMAFRNQQVCERCGAQVVDHNKHNRWHDQLEQKLREHENAAVQIRNLRRG